MHSILSLISLLIDIYVWILIAGAVMSWLIAFNVINQYNDFVRQVFYFIDRVTEPALAPIRRIIPPMGGLDLSPMILIIAMWFLRNLMFELLL